MGPSWLYRLAQRLARPQRAVQSPARAQQRAVFEELEPRLLYSADSPGAWLPSAVVPSAVVQVVPAADTTPVQARAVASKLSVDADTPPAPQTQRHEIVFVDAAVPDAQALVDSLLAQRPADAAIEIVQIRSDADALQQINAVLSGQRDVDAVHLISHGDAGRLWIGSGLIDESTLQARSGDFSAWHGALSPEADLLLWGCDVAAGPSGASFIAQLAQLTGADVAASTDATGHQALGGNWLLEARTGDVAAQAALGAVFQAQWVGLLPTHQQFTHYSAESEIRSNAQWGQTFTHTSGGGTYNVNQVSLALRRDVGAPAQTITVELRSSWNGAVLGSATVDSASLGTSFSFVDLGFTGVALTDGASYTLRVRSDSLAGAVYVGTNPAGGYAGGTKLNNSGVALGGEDLAFKVAATPTVAVDASSSVATDGVASVNLAHTTSGSNRLMLVSVATDPHTERVSSITYNGVGLSLVGVEEILGSHSRVEIWSLVAPATGTHNVVVNMTGTGYNGLAVGVTTFNGVHQTSPLLDFDSAGGNSTAAAVTVASAARNLVFAAVHSHNGASVLPGAGQTEYWDVAMGQSNGGASGQAGTGAVTSTWTVDNGDWSAAAVSIQADSNSTVAFSTGAVKDAYIEQLNPTTNHGLLGSLVVDRETGDLQRVLVQFDLSSLPANAVVINAQLKLEASAIGGSLNIAAYPLQQSWTETGATWNEASAGVNWGVAGGSYNATALDTVATEVAGQHRWDVTSLAQAWVAGTQPNHGLMVASPDGGGDRMATYFSREGAVDPVFEVAYYLANTAPGATNLSSAEGYTEDTALNLADIVITDPDSANIIAATLTLSDSAAGSLSTATSGGVTSTYNAGTGVWSASGALADVNNLLAALTFTPAPNYNSSFSIATSVSDGEALAVGGSKAMTGTAVNDAPVLDNTGTMTLPTITKVHTNNGGSAVETIIASAGGDRITDVDGGAEGMAITALASGNGSWEYSTDGGASFSAVGAVSGTSALLLRNIDYMRFVPNGVSATTASFDFRAWDQSSGSAGSKVSVASNGAATPFSTALETASIVVDDVNVAPVLDSSKSPVLAALNEDSGAPVGAVGTLVSALVDYASPAGQVDNVTDVDAGAGLGIAVTAANTSNGSWFYSVNNGTTWNALGAVSDASARLLASDANTRLYFQPTANYFGTLANAITFRAWDQTSGSNGGTAAVNVAHTVLDTFSTVAYTNSNGTQTWASNWIEVGDSNGASGGGIKVVNTNELQVTAETAPYNVYRGVDLSNASAATFSFAYTSTLAGSRVIEAQVSANGGSSYTTLATFNASTNTGSGTKSYDIGAYMASNTRIRFIVAAGGSAVENVRFDNVQIQYTSAGGGTSAFSTATDTASIAVNAVADTPAVSNTTTNEDTQSAGGLVISRHAADGAEVTHFKVTSTANGTLYQSDGTTPITNGSFITVAEGNAGLKFTPVADFNGSASFTVQASTSNNDAGLGGSAVNAVVTVAAVNDAPVLPDTALTLTVAEDAGAPVGAVGALVGAYTGGVVDVDSAAVKGLAIIATDESNGTWYYSTNSGSNWTAVAAVSNASSLLLADNASSRLYFSPLANFSGSSGTALTLRAWDQTSGVAGTRVNTSGNGGTTAFSAATDSVDVTVTAFNDLPTSSNVQAYVGSDSSLVLEAADFKFVDVDAGDTLQQLRISNITGGGSLRLNGAVVTNNQVISRADIDAGLLVFTPAAGQSGAAYAGFDFLVHDGTAYAAGGSRLTLDVGGLTPFYSARLQGGDAIVASAGMRTSGSFTGGTLTPTLTVAGIPASATVVAAYLYVTELDFGSIDTTFTLNGTPFSGSVVGASADPNWGSTRAVTLAMNVTAAVTGNGSYVLGGANGLGADAYEGATLVVVVEDTTSATDTLVTLQQGSLTHRASNTAISLPFNGGAAVGQPIASAQVKLVTFDGQDVHSEAAIFFQASSAGSATSVIAANSFVSAGGGRLQSNLDVAGLVAAADTGAVLTQGAAGGTEALVHGFVATVIKLDNAAPVLANTALTMAVVEDAGLPSGAVGSLVSSLLGGATDADSAAVKGVALVATSGANGSWHYSLDGGATWAAVGAVNNGSSLLLASDAATRLYFAPAADYSGTANAALTLRAWDQTSGVAGTKVSTVSTGSSTAFSSATDVVDVTVSAVNDAPTATNLNAAEIFTEDTALNLTDIVVSDIDSANVTATLTLSNPAAGAFSVASAGSVTASYNAATGVWQASGALADVNSLLASLVFTPALNFNGVFTVATSVDDGVAAALAGSKSFTGVAVNDAPTASNLNSAETYTEDLTLNLADIVAADIDSSSGSVTLVLSNPLAGLLGTGSSGAVSSSYNPATGVWTASGAFADINVLLAALSFTPTPDFNSAFSISTSVSDGVAAPVTGSKNFTGVPVNDAPTASNLNASETTNEDQPLNLVDIVISDIDSANVNARLTLSNPLAGALGVASAGSVTSSYNAATGAWQASGARADVNSLLAGLVLTPALNFNGAFTVATGVDDGVAAALLGSKSFVISPVNDAPTASNLNTAETYTEDTPLNLVDIVVADADNTTVTVTLTLSDATAGSLSTGTSGAVSSSYSTGTGVWSASGALADVNVLLAGVVFTPATHHSSGFNIATSVGDGLAAPVTGNKTVDVTPVNDAPTASNLNAAESTFEDMPLNLTDIVTADVDSANLTVTLTLSDPATGALSTGAAGAVTSSYNVGTGVWTASGALADVNTLLAGLVFTPAPDFNGGLNIATSVSDGVAPAVTGSKAVTVMAVNDAPTASNLNAAETYTEDTLLDLIDIAVSDIDSSGSVTLTLSDPAVGMLATATSGAVTSTFNASTGVWSASGAIADINILLAAVQFVPALNVNGGFSVATWVSDGVAAPLLGSKVFSGVAVNDAPVLDTLGRLTVAEGSSTPLGSAQLQAADVDNTSTELTYTLLSAPVHGSLLNNGQVLAVGSRFTQADLDAGRVAYRHDASETTADAFDFSLGDGQATGASGSVAIAVTPVIDEVPRITSPVLGVTVPENTTAVARVTATDADLPPQTLQFAIAGGADAAFFTVNSSTGELSFIAAPDFETPLDSDRNNVYLVDLRVSDGVLSSVSGMAVTVAPVNDNTPRLTSSGGAAQALLEVQEGNEAVVNLTATDADQPPAVLVYAIVGGADAARFTVNAASGALRFVDAPLTIDPRDRGADNVYQVVVQASDGSRLAQQALSIKVRAAVAAAAPSGPSTVQTPQAPTHYSGGPVQEDAAAPPVLVAAPPVRPMEDPVEDETLLPLENRRTALVRLADAVASRSRENPLPLVASVPALDEGSGVDPSLPGQDTSSLEAALGLPGTEATFLQVRPDGLSLAGLAAQTATRSSTAVPGPLTLSQPLGDAGDGADDNDTIVQALAAPVVAGGMALSASLLVWATRAGGLAAAMMASVPAWRSLDPLPILARDRSREEGDDSHGNGGSEVAGRVDGAEDTADTVSRTGPAHSGPVDPPFDGPDDPVPGPTVQRGHPSGVMRELLEPLEAMR